MSRTAAALFVLALVVLTASSPLPNLHAEGLPPGYIGNREEKHTLNPLPDSLNIRLVGKCNLPEESVHCLHAQGPYVYAANKGSGLRVIDVSDPENPHEVGYCDTPGVSHRVHIVDSLAYVADEGGGLRIINISTPTNPVEIGYCTSSGAAHGIYSDGLYAYLAAELGGLRILDVSDPTNPFEAAFWDSSGWAFDCWLSGSYLYLVDLNASLWVLDVSDPTNPQRVGHCGTGGAAYTLHVSENYAYVAADNAGLRVLDISDPFNPSEVGSLVLPDDARDVWLAGSYLYLADDWAGLRMIDVSDPTTPEEVGHYDPGQIALAVSASGPYIYLAGDNLIDFRVLENLLMTGIEESAASRLEGSGLSSVSPEPSFGPVKISYRLCPQERANVRLIIYDQSGRRVRLLVDKETQQGEREVTWDGADSRGHSVPAGVYFCHLETGNDHLTMKITRLR